MGAFDDFDAEAWIASWQKYDPIIQRIHRPANLADHFSALREFYAEQDFKRYSPYPHNIDWVSEFTPIEYSVWCDIRCAGIPFWPQLPVGRYFVDFGDPLKRIAIECDGKQWHNPEKDAARDAELERDCWTVIRLTGAECNRIRSPDWEAVAYDPPSERQTNEIRDWLNNTSEGVITALAMLAYDQTGNCELGDAERALRKHVTAGGWQF